MSCGPNRSWSIATDPTARAATETVDPEIALSPVGRADGRLDAEVRDPEPAAKHGGILTRSNWRVPCVAGTPSRTSSEPSSMMPNSPRGEPRLGPLGSRKVSNCRAPLISTVEILLAPH